MQFAYQKFTHEGMTKTVSEWCTFFGISYSTVKTRRSRGATSFDDLFKIRQAQVRYKELVTVETGEKFLADRTVDLLELMFDESLRGQILHIAQLDRENGYHFGRTEWGEPERKYSVRETINHLIWRGIRSWNKEVHDNDVIREREGRERFERLKDETGVIPEVIHGGGTFSRRVTPAQTETRVTNNTWKPLTPEEDLAEIKAIFGE